MLGYMTVDYDQGAFPFSRLVEGALGQGPLAQLHERFDPPSSVVRGNDQAHPVYRMLYDIGEPFRELYRTFVRGVVTRLLGNDIVVQAKPNFRVQFPGVTAVYGFHRDTDNDHPASEISFWVPLTPVGPTNGLWIESAPGLEDYHPVEVSPGQVLAFDCAALGHGNMVNEEGFTRVSFDFRAVRRHTFADSEGESVNLRVPFRIGQYYEAVGAV